MVSTVDINDNICWPNFPTDCLGCHQSEPELDDYDRDRAEADAIPASVWAAVGTRKGGAA